MGQKNSQQICMTYIRDNWKFEKYIPIDEFKKAFIDYEHMRVIIEDNGFKFNIVRSFNNGLNCFYYFNIIDYPVFVSDDLIAGINEAMKLKLTKPNINLSNKNLEEMIDIYNYQGISVNYNTNKINNGCIFYEYSYVQFFAKKVINAIIHSYTNKKKQTLPQYVIKLLKDNIKAEDECTICAKTANEITRENIEILYCGHWFCRECAARLDECAICRF
jgi:hypothetical protein